MKPKPNKGPKPIKGSKPNKGPKPNELLGAWQELWDKSIIKWLLITFSIGKYKDEVLCDVVPMEATHILLGRPWQFDRKKFHDGFTNKISFNFHGHKLILKSLSPKEVHEDQVKMREKRKKKKLKIPREAFSYLPNKFKR